MENEVTKHSLLKSIVLHLLPGILIGGVYFLIIPFVIKKGYPSVMALIIAAAFVLIPFELGVLLHQKRLENKRLFGGIVKYTKRIPVWQYLVWVTLVFIISGLVFTAFNFSTNFIKSLFTWLPAEMFLDMGLNKTFSIPKLVVTYISLFFVIVIIAPATEELYFRGYLLPRMPEKLKGWTEIIHSGLFALYHTWTPWTFIARTFAVLPLIYLVKRKENILLGIIIHSLMNSIDFIMGIVFILNY